MFPERNGPASLSSIIMSWQHELGRQIRDARVRAGMTQAELARHLTVSRETVSNYENGKSPALVNVIAEIAQVLDAEFAIGGCKITKADIKRILDAPAVEQLCFAYDTVHRYKTAILTIRPTRKSIIISAVVARTR
jgi:transcriptional regulator with XRE-family HTH domain